MKLSPFVFVLTTATVAAAGPATKAVAVLSPTQGSTASGKVVFTKVEGGVKVSVSVTGLKEGTHGFHIHEFGDCTAPDATSAGGHFNPAGEPHAGPKDAHRHTGDLGNIEANKDGVATAEYVDAGVSFEGATTVLGRGVIVHEKADDLKTQPTGAAGARVACGVVGAAKGD